MRIALVGATGIIGSKVLAEAARRGHAVTAICRHPDKIPALPNVKAHRADILVRKEAEIAFVGHDVVVSCYNAGHNPGPGQNIYKDIIEGVVNLIVATKAAKVSRLLFVGGAGALHVTPGVPMIEFFGFGEVEGTNFPEELTSKMPPEFSLWSNVLRDDIKHEHVVPLVRSLMFFEHDRTYDWSFFSPPAGLHPGPRQGVYVVGTNQVPMNGDKFAGLSIEDAAIVIVDECENNAQAREHWTAYTPG